MSAQREALPAAADPARLAELEQVIERGLGTFVDVCQRCSRSRSDVSTGPLVIGASPNTSRTAGICRRLTPTGRSTLPRSSIFCPQVETSRCWPTRRRHASWHRSCTIRTPCERSGRIRSSRARVTLRRVRSGSTSPPGGHIPARLEPLHDHPPPPAPTSRARLADISGLPRAMRVRLPLPPSIAERDAV